MIKISFEIVLDWYGNIIGSFYKRLVITIQYIVDGRFLGKFLGNFS